MFSTFFSFPSLKQIRFHKITELGFKYAFRFNVFAVKIFNLSFNFKRTLWN